ncbi:MAG TPA: hypothetical protein VHS35_01705 [Pseudonocardia sp.]|nr:hypothetical protein [Pseudonocardia sp.]
MTADRERPDVRLLAALDAGLLDEATAREVRAAAEADPASRAVLHALAATRAELAAHPDPPVPPALAERWSAALAAEQQSRPSGPTPHAAQQAASPPSPAATNKSAAPTSAAPTPAAPPAAAASAGSQSSASPPTNGRSTAPHGDGLEAADIAPRADAEPPPPPSGHRVVPTTRGRRESPSCPPRKPARRPGRLLRRPAVLAAALLIAVGVGAALRARPEPLPTVGRPQLVAEALSAVGVRDTAALADPSRRAGCLRAVDAPVESPEAPLLGGRRVTFEGTEGVLLVLGTGRRGAFDVLIVDPDCGPGAGKLLAATRVTPR